MEFIFYLVNLHIGIRLYGCFDVISTNFYLIMSKVITDPALISQAIEIINDSIDIVLKDEADANKESAGGYAWIPGPDLIWGSDGDMPQCGSPSAQSGSSTPLSRVPSSYKCDVDIIYDLFDPIHYTAKGEITLTLVMQRLSLMMSCKNFPRVHNSTKVEYNLHTLSHFRRASNVGGKSINLFRIINN